MEFFGLKLDESVVKVLLELEKVEGFWHIPRSSGVLLAGLVGCLGFNRVLEVGTSSGYSGIFLADALRSRAEEFGVDARLYTIESHDLRFKFGGENFKSAGVDAFVERIKGHAPEVIYEKFYEDKSELRVKSEFAGFFDMIFIDATKMEYFSYVKAIYPLIREDGLIVLDNFLSHSADMEGLLSQMSTLGLSETFLLPIDNGLFFCFKG